MQQYVDLLNQVLATEDQRVVEGKVQYAVFGTQMRFDISGFRFPLVTLRNTHPKQAIQELLWMLKGESTVDTLLSQGIDRWNPQIVPGTKVYRELNLIERLRTDEGIPYQESHNPERFFSTEEKPEHEYVEIYNLWRPIGLTERLHAELDELGVPRQALVGGDLANAPGVHWRKRPDVQVEEPLRCAQAYRYLQASGSLMQVTERFEALFGPGSLDLWVLMAGNTRRLDTYEEEDRFIIDQLASLGYPTTEMTTTKATDQLRLAVEQLKTNSLHRRPSVFVRDGDGIDSLFEFYTRSLSHVELVNVVLRSTLVRKADLELFNSYDPVEREQYLALEPTVLEQWVTENGLPTKGLSCHLYQNKVDLYNEFPTSIAMQVLLTKMVANCVGMEPLELIWTGADCYLTQDKLHVVQQEIAKGPLAEPKIMINSEIRDLDAFSLTDFTLVDYQHH